MPGLSWEDRNQKWVTLSNNMRASGWSTLDARTDRLMGYDPRLLKRHYFSGRAAILETQEKDGARTIYAYAVRWKKPPSYQAIQVWIHPGFDGRVIQDRYVCPERMLKE